MSSLSKTDEQQLDVTDLETISQDEGKVEEFIESLDPKQLYDLQESLKDAPLVGPQVGPQMAAFNSKADVLGYGGGAGGGKSALLAMVAVLNHTKAVIFRRDGKETGTLMEEAVKFAGTDDGLNRQSGVFRLPDGGIIEFGGLGNPGDEKKWQGREHDLIGVDEATEVRGDKFRFVMTWLRSSKRGQRCRAILTFNPPGGPDDPGGNVGRWVIDFFAPWLDERHPNPALPGELRYFITDADGIDKEVPDATPVEVEVGGEKYYQTPQSRTFIPALAVDNVYLRNTGYIDNLLSLPEPHRSRMLKGMFHTGVADDEYQILPTKWVDAAMARWREAKEGFKLDQFRRENMNSLGIDVARSGADRTVLARRHGWFWDELIEEPGQDTPNGRAVMALALQHVRDHAWICIDSGGIGASPYDYLRDAVGQQCVGIQGQQRKGLPKLHEEHDTMFNMRATLYWMLRLALDPDKGLNIMLPDDPKLRSELLAMRFHRKRGPVLVEEKEEVKLRLGYSPDRADAVVYSLRKVSETANASRILRGKKNVDRNILHGRGRIQVPKRLPGGGTWMRV